MKTRLFIHLHDSAGDSASWAQLGKGEQRPSEVQRGQLAAIPVPDEDTHVTMFVPATDVLLTEVSIPSRNRRQLASATPYALEDQLIDDIEDMHFALGRSNAEGKTSVATVANSKLEEWLARLAENRIKADAVYSEAQALPVDDKSWSLLQLDQRCVIRSATDHGYGLECSNLGSFVERMVSNAASMPENINVITCAANDDLQADVVDALPLAVERQQCPGDALVSLIEGSQLAPGINLLQGRYETRRPVFSGIRRWLPAAVMLLLWLGLQFGVVINDTIRLSAEENQLREDIANAFRDAFPGAKNTARARERTEQELESLKSGGSSSSFLDLLSRGGEIFAKTNGVVLTSISYRDGSMDIALTLKDLQGLDNIKQSLVDKLGVDVDIQSATPKDKLIEARLRIRRKS